MKNIMEGVIAMAGKRFASVPEIAAHFKVSEQYVSAAIQIGNQWLLDAPSVKGADGYYHALRETVVSVSGKELVNPMLVPNVNLIRELSTRHFQAVSPFAEALL